MSLRRIKADAFTLAVHLWLLPTTLLTIAAIIATYAGTACLIFSLPSRKKEFIQGRGEFIESMKPLLESRWSDAIAAGIWFLIILWRILRI